MPGFRSTSTRSSPARELPTPGRARSHQENVTTPLVGFNWSNSVLAGIGGDRGARAGAEAAGRRSPAAYPAA
jgi:hypothetical protein